MNPQQRPPQLPTYHPEMGFPVYAMPQYPTQPQPQPQPQHQPYNFLDSPIHFWLNLGVGLALGSFLSFMLWDGMFGGDCIRAAQTQARLAQEQAQTAQAQQDALETELNRIRGCIQ